MCVSSRNNLPPNVRSCSATVVPWTKPASRTETVACEAGTRAPLRYACGSLIGIASRGSGRRRPVFPLPGIATSQFGVEHQAHGGFVEAPGRTDEVVGRCVAADALHEHRRRQQ